MGFEKSDIDEAPLRLTLWPHSHCQCDRKRERPHHVIDCRLRVVNGVADRIGGRTTADRMAAHRKSDQCRDDPCGGGLHKGCLISAILFPPPRNVYDQSEQHGEEDCLQDKLLSVDVAGHDEERCVGIARKSEKTASAVRCKHQRQDDGKKDG